MANIYVGFHDRKSCSRILKPPGGGTSDIFNTSLEEQTNNTDNKNKTTAVKKETTVESTIKTTINGNELKKENELQELKTQNGKIEENDNEVKPEDVKIETLTISESSNETTKGNEKDGSVEVKTVQSTEINSSASKTESLSSIVHQSQHVEVKTNATERRSINRVPPGGYSSGLW